MFTNLAIMRSSVFVHNWIKSASAVVGGVCGGIVAGVPGAVAGSGAGYAAGHFFTKTE